MRGWKVKQSRRTPAASTPKAVDEASPEEGLYALMSSTWRQHGGVGHHAGARARLLTVLVGEGLTIGSEIVSLSAAYAAMRPHIVGSGASPARLLDHMLWARRLFGRFCKRFHRAYQP